MLGRPCALLVLLAYTWVPAAAKTGASKSKHGAGSSSKAGRHKKKPPSENAVQQRGSATLHADSGARYRVLLHSSAGEPRYMYRDGDAIVAHRVFFSLFRWQQLDNGAHLLGDHAGERWLTLEVPRNTPDVKPRLALGGLASNRTRSYAQPLWPRATSHQGCNKPCFALHVEDGAAAMALGLNHAPESAALIQASAATTASVFELQPIITAAGAAASSPAATPGLDEGSTRSSERSFEERVKRSVTTLQGRSFVLVTYHNVGMLDWATLFWRWLAFAGMRRFMLLELDGQTCDAARALNSSRHVHFECATARDMRSMLPAAMTTIRSASSMQEWGTDADSGYFKFLRWKLAIVEKLLAQGVDALMADVDVLVMGPRFFTSLATSSYDLTISSDARAGSYNDNHHCPCSHPMYQRFASDWVCAGLFYMRATKASQWFMREVQGLMDEFVITDQDAIQAVLTGHTQVAVPQAKVDVNDPSYNATLSRFRGYPRGYRPSAAWLKPLWLEGLEPGQTLRNMRGIQPLNTPMRPGMWERLSARRRASSFSWTTAPTAEFANGPTLYDQWHKTFAKRRKKDESYASVHANCNVKSFLADERNGNSFLLHPPGGP